MANGKLLRKLIRAGSQGDEDSFREISKEVIRHERQREHHLLANDLVPRNEERKVMQLPAMTRVWT